MERNNPKHKTEKNQSGKLIIAGVLIAALIALLYFGFFAGEKAEKIEQQEEPATPEQNRSGSLKDSYSEPVTEMINHFSSPLQILPPILN